VLEADSLNSTALFHRGCCYEALQELDLSIEDYTKALSLESGSEGPTEDFKEAE